MDGHIHNFPVWESRSLLKANSPYVYRNGDMLSLFDRAGNIVIRAQLAIETVDILEDTKSVEVFVNGGENSFTCWLQ